MTKLVGRAKEHAFRFGRSGFHHARNIQPMFEPARRKPSDARKFVHEHKSFSLQVLNTYAGLFFSRDSYNVLSFAEMSFTFDRSIAVNSATFFVCDPLACVHKLLPKKQLHQ